MLDERNTCRSREETLMFNHVEEDMPGNIPIHVDLGE
jgi:hypothetical protein